MSSTASGLAVLLKGSQRLSVTGASHGDDFGSVTRWNRPSPVCACVLNRQPLNQHFRRCSSRSAPRFARVVVGAVEGNDFKERASHAVYEAQKTIERAGRTAWESAEEAIGTVQRRVEQFGRENDLEMKARDTFRAANQAVSDVRDRVVENTEKLDADYHLREKAQRFADVVQAQAQRAESALGVGSKLRNMRNDFQQNLPTCRRQASRFFATPVGQLLWYTFLFWLLLSGWGLRLLSLGFLFFPLVPFFLRGLLQQNFVQGNCPTCGLQYAGPKSATLVCRRCRSAVWRPGGSGERIDPNSPNVIDVEIID